MDDLFKTRALTGALNQLRPAPTLILDRVFKRKEPQLTDRFAWDIQTQSEGIMPNISVYAEASVSDNEGMKTVTCQSPRFSEKRMISAADLNGMRAFGSQVSVQLLTTKIGAVLASLKRKADITREFQAAMCLSGKVVDAKGVVLVDYGFSAAQKPVLTLTNRWSDPASDPLKDIRGWKKLIGQAAGNVSQYVAFVGTDVMDALMNHTKVLELLKYTHGKETAEEGRIINLAGVELVEYQGSYIDSNGARQDLVPPTHFRMIGLTGDHGAELFAPVVDLESPNGVGMGKPGDMFFSKSWLVKDPSGRWIKVEVRPLPVLMRPECVIDATPV